MKKTQADIQSNPSLLNNNTIYNEILEAFDTWLENKYPGKIDRIYNSVITLLDNNYIIDQLKILDDIIYKKIDIIKGIRKYLKDNYSEYI